MCDYSIKCGYNNQNWKLCSEAGVTTMYCNINRSTLIIFNNKNEECVLERNLVPIFTFVEALKSSFEVGIEVKPSLSISIYVWKIGKRSRGL